MLSSSLVVSEIRDVKFTPLIIRVESLDSSQDPTNLNGKLQKQQNFEQELNANHSRIEEITNTGQELLNSNHYAAGKLTVLSLNLKEI